MQAVTLEVILRAVFGVTDPGRRERLRTLLPRLLEGSSSTAMQARVLLMRRSDPFAALRPLMDEIDALLHAEIAERRADPGATAERTDILSLLESATFEDGTQMSDGELRDQLVTLLLAGHETTATGLAWTMDLLVRHPRVLTRLNAELGEDSGRYMRATIQESLRLRPVVPLAGRRLANELRTDGLSLPAGTDVTPAIWLTHTRDDLYPRPYAFEPERFLERPPTTYGWVPYGGGVRRCLGASFAELEMRIVLETILRRRAPESANGRAERVTRRNVTFSPRHGTRIVARPLAV
jgi:cytochrome P450